MRLAALALAALALIALGTSARPRATRASSLGSQIVCLVFSINNSYGAPLPVLDSGNCPAGTATSTAALTVIKQVVNTGGGTAVAGDFTITVTGTNPSSASFAGSESGTTISLDAGSYTVGEVASSTYTLSTGGDCSGTIAAGESKTCTLTNTYVPPPASIPGCTDPKATNYNAAATADDGSCTYASQTITGCTDPAATNYNADATQDDGSCTYPGGSGTTTPTTTTTTPSTPSTAGHHGGGGGAGCRAGTAWSPATNSCVPVGQVLGAATSSPACGLSLTSHLRYGSSKNDPGQVVILQTFLTAHGYGTLTSGVFDRATEAAVKAFQTAYAGAVLTPWHISAPTGLVYLTTAREINLIACPSLSIPIPTLIPWGQNPGAQ